MYFFRLSFVNCQLTIFRSILLLTFILNGVFGYSQDCPEKIKWNKLREVTEVKAVLAECLPLKSDKATILAFLEKNKCVFSYNDPTKTVYASALTKSKSMWIEKKWMMEFILDENGLLKEIKVEAGLTGP